MGKEEAEKIAEDFLNQPNTELYAVNVKIKNRTTFYSEVFKYTAEVVSYYAPFINEEKNIEHKEVYYAVCRTSKQNAEDAKDRLTPDGKFLRLGNIDINIEEIVTKEVVKV